MCNAFHLPHTLGGARCARGLFSRSVSSLCDGDGEAERERGGGKDFKEHRGAVMALSLLTPLVTLLKPEA